MALVARRRQPIEVEDTAAALLDYRSGATGYVYATTCEGGNSKRFEFVGERGRVVVQQGQIRRFAFDRPLAEALAVREASAKIVETEVPVELPARPTCSAVWDHVVRHLRDKMPLRLDAASGLDSLALSCAMVLSSERRQWVRLPVSSRAYDAFLAAKRRAGRRLP